MEFIIYVDRSGQWRWYLKARNGRKIADSGEGYINRQDCMNAIGLVKQSALAPIYQQ